MWGNDILEYKKLIRHVLKKRCCFSWIAIQAVMVFI